MNTQRLLPPNTEMQKAFQTRDASYDGIFFTGVRTTGIFCRPSCPARKPLAENLQFFSSAKEALFAGYRACQRCQPLETNQPDWVRNLLLHIDQNATMRLKDSDMRELGVDPVRVRRYFQKQFGLTFQAYLRARRLGKALEEIRKGSDLLEVGFEHGYESSSGFRQAFLEAFGKSPGKGRDAECIVMAWIESPVGPLIAGANAGAICFLEFTDRRMLEAQFAVVKKRFGTPIVPGTDELLDRLKQQLNEYFMGTRKQFDVPLDFRGSQFQLQVWSELLKIPYGETRSYEDIASAIGATRAVRAVGHANGCNRIAIVIPCHRVVNKDGKLGGYGGGLWRKQYLLDLERGSR